MTAVLLRIAAILVLLLTAGYVGIQYSSSTWPMTEGVVGSSGWARESILGNGVKGEFQVHYEYTVGGKRYVNDRLSYAGNLSIARIVRTVDGTSKNVERSPHSGDVVEVRYAPWAPSISVLVPGPAPRAWIWAVVAVLFGIICFSYARLSQHPVY